MNFKPLTAGIAAMIVLGCGTARGGPESIPLDHANCARCGMLISSDANAAQSQTAGRPTRFFDDVGCLAGAPDATFENSTRYVRLASGGWAPTESAWFAQSAAANTPMDYGILAFATEQEARSADRDGQARRWPAIAAIAKVR